MKHRPGKINYTQTEPQQLKRLIPLFFIIFIDTMAYFIVIPVLLRLFVSGHFSILPEHTSLATRDLIYGIAVMLSPLAFLLAAPFVGNLSDRFGRKKLLFASLIISLVGFILPIIGIYKNSLSLILIGRFIAGASTSSQPVAQAAITDFTKGKRRAFYLSMIGFAMTLAMVLGPLSGGYLSDHTLVSWFNVTTPYWAGVVLSIINIILLSFLENSSQLLYHADQKTWKDNLITLYQALKQRSVFGLMLVFFFFEFAWGQYYQSIFLYLTQQWHYSTDKVGVFTAYIGFWMCLGLTLIYKIAIRYIALERLLGMSLLIICFGLIICNIPTNPIWQWLGIIPTTIAIGVAYPSLLACISNHTSADHQGWVLGSASTALGLAWMITAFTSGWLISIASFLPALASLIAIFVGTFIYFNFLKR